MRLVFCVCFVLIYALGIHTARAVSPGQAFALMDPGDSAMAYRHYLAMPVVDGIAVRSAWARLEPTKGRFNWNRIDTAFAAARAAHKKVTLHIIAAAYASPPPWLRAEGMHTYREFNPFRPGMPSRQQAVPWDGVFLSEWATFLGALKTHLQQQGDNATLAYISDGVPEPEMSLIGCRDGMLAAMPYSRARYLHAWETSIAAMQQAFPSTTKLVSAPVSQICWPDNDGARFYDLLLDYMRRLDKRTFMIFAADLNALGSQRVANLAAAAHALPVGFQFIWSYSHDPHQRFKGSLEDAICKGYRLYGSRYYEVYKQDLDNPAYNVKKAIALIHNLDHCDR